MALKRQRVNQQAQLPTRRSHRSFFPYLFSALFLLTLVDSWRRAEIDPKVFFEAKGRDALWKFLTGMFPPDLSWNFLSLMLRPTLESLSLHSRIRVGFHVRASGRIGAVFRCFSDWRRLWGDVWKGFLGDFRRS